MSDHNIKGKDYYRVANAVKTRNIRELIECINQDIVQFDVSYGPYGTILDYGLYLDNMKLLGVIYLAILKGQNFDKITLHPKHINQQFVEIIRSFEKAEDSEERNKLEFKIAMMLDLRLIDFAAHVTNDIFCPNYKILDLSLSLYSPYIFNGLVGYLLKTGMNYEEICKLISFNISANEILFDSDTPVHTTNLMKSQIPHEYLVESWRQYNISESKLQDLVEQTIQDITEGDNSLPEFVSEIIGAA